MVGGVARLTAAVHSLGIRAIQSSSEVGRTAASKLGVGTVGVTGVTWLGRLMGWAENASDSVMQALCLANCSAHGECYNGTCFCEVINFYRFPSLLGPLLSTSVPQTGPVRGCRVCRTELQLSHRVCQCVSSGSRHLSDSAVHLHSRRIRPAQDAVRPPSLPYHQPEVSLHPRFLCSPSPRALLRLSGIELFTVAHSENTTPISSFITGFYRSVVI